LKDVLTSAPPARSPPGQQAAEDAVAARVELLRTRRAVDVVGGRQPLVPYVRHRHAVERPVVADIFSSAGRDPGARIDAYFEPAGQQLLANLLLAAALAEHSITQVYLWLSNPTDDEPVAVLAEHDYPLLAVALHAFVIAPEKQRGGVYGTVTQMSFLTNRQAMQWVTPDAARQLEPTHTAPANQCASGAAAESNRREFRPEDFVRTQASTIYSVSKEARGNAAPLVRALTVAITEAAEDL
jgi:hypothetical protein